MNNTLSGIQGIFGLAAFITGIFCGRPKRAAIWGAFIGALCATLFVTLGLSAGVNVFNNAEFAGRIIGGPIVGCLLVALVGYGIKRLFRGKPNAAPNS
jgi:hypothetical protein